MFFLGNIFVGIKEFTYVDSNLDAGTLSIFHGGGETYSWIAENPCPAVINAFSSKKDIFFYYRRII